MSIPVKPFPSYKWRWLSVAPSEGLLKAPVFLGVIRALSQFEGDAFNSDRLIEELDRVRRDTNTEINLARTGDRNLIRNSGQYWRGTGLLTAKRGEVELTDFGRQVALGRITNDEFAALMVRNTVLPNPATYGADEVANWRRVGLRIKPFELILAVMDRLGRTYGVPEAFLSSNELISVVIPLAGTKATIDKTVESVFEFRKGRLDVSEWPDCVPAANDKRLAREFLLFLANFGICQIDQTADRYEQRFYLDEVMNAEMQQGDEQSFLENIERIDEEVATSRNSEIPLIIERTRISASVLRRPNQSRFRREVLDAGARRCILTQEPTLEVLEAAHIIPVGNGGTDLVGNGLCMRVDIHRLYDSGKIRIAPSGNVTLHEQIETAISYAGLPRHINFPHEIRAENLEWRARYA